MKISSFLSILIVFILSISCEYSKIKDVPTPTNISFSKDIVPIFTTNCSGCHSATGQSPDLSSANSIYTNIVTAGLVDTTAAATSSIYKTINSGAMPPSGKLSSKNDTLILNWIKQGAKNN